MFRNGGSEYAINGTGCRLLDVQELLSDSGIGREMHVIVGQGQLDAVLRASPEERRGFIEEAAGVLKHRKRKEKALRKLEAMSLNLTRLQDLTGELRRQLKPLGARPRPPAAPPSSRPTPAMRGSASSPTTWSTCARPGPRGGRRDRAAGPAGRGRGRSGRRAGAREHPRGARARRGAARRPGAGDLVRVVQPARALPRDRRAGRRAAAPPRGGPRRRRARRGATPRRSTAGREVRREERETLAEVAAGGTGSRPCSRTARRPRRR
jgi:hypothetical protein